MEPVVKRDLRVEKTLDAIHKSFEELLMQKPYSKITVTALCQLARINKKTFYRYYPTLDDLRAELVENFAKPYADMTTGLRYPDHIERLTRTFLTYSAKQGPLYDDIICNSAHEELLDDIIVGMEKERYAISTPYPGWSDNEWHLYMMHVTTTQVTIYRQWVKDKRDVPLETMVEIGSRLVCQGGKAV